MRQFTSKQGEGVLEVGFKALIPTSDQDDYVKLKEALLSREGYFTKAYKQGERFLAHPIRHFKWRIYRARRMWKA